MSLKIPLKCQFVLLYRGSQYKNLKNRCRSNYESRGKRIRSEIVAVRTNLSAAFSVSAWLHKEFLSSLCNHEPLLVIFLYLLVNFIFDIFACFNSILRSLQSKYVGKYFTYKKRNVCQYWGCQYYGENKFSVKESSFP